MEWQPIETAPKGSGPGLVTAPDYIEPPLILLYFPQQTEYKVVSCYWDWYYADGGNGYNGYLGWVEPTSGEQAEPFYGEPTHWMPLPEPPCR